MKYSFIAIEREYGSGGTQIAQKLGEKIGMEVYGKKLLEMVSERCGISVEKIQKYEEQTTNSFLYSIVMMERYSSGQAGAGEFSGEETIFYHEQQVIREIAKKGSGIFIGHCCSQALSDHGDVLRVFLYGDESSKNKRCSEEYHIPMRSADAVRKAFDRKRANYFSANTGKKWSDPTNYDVLLNTGSIGIDGAVEALALLMQQE